MRRRLLRLALTLAVLAGAACQPPTEVRCRQDTLRFVLDWRDANGTGPVDTLRTVTQSCRQVRRGTR